MTTPLQLGSRAVRAVRAVDTVTRGTRPTPGQLALTGFWLAAMLTTTSVRTGTFERPGAPLLLAVLAAWAPLLLRTWRPALALAGALVAESTILIFLAVPDAVTAPTGGMGAYQPVPLASMLAVATLAARAPRATGWLAGVGAGAVLAVLGVAIRSTETYLTDLVVFYLVVTAAALGVWRSGLRERAARAARERDEHARQAVLDERLRIARELHDVLAHNLTLVNAQAGVARYLLRTDPGAAESALRDITQHTGRAIDELRATVGLLRSRDDDPGAAGADAALRPVPGLAALDELLDRVRSAGTRVELATSGTPGRLDQHADLAAYRILQESLTNAAKHAPGATVDVGLTWTGAGVRLRVANPVGPDTGPDRAPAPGTGNGLIGMRERATAAGGTLRAGPAPDGGFEVVATLPAQPAPEPTDPAPTPTPTGGPR
ncbi:sensor histidine kinase [Cellulomonas sp. NPDC058312]|uniref:sensor histidine kinase n=1 Tax=Cellulomonas sp. NPDC058312 TaxID=3346441 RepID=UPI0036ED74F2